MKNTRDTVSEKIEKNIKSTKGYKEIQDNPNLDNMNEDNKLEIKSFPTIEQKQNKYILNFIINIVLAILCIVLVILLTISIKLNIDTGKKRDELIQKFNQVNKTYDEILTNKTNSSNDNNSEKEDDKLKEKEKEKKDDNKEKENDNKDNQKITTQNSTSSDQQSPDDSNKKEEKPSNNEEEEENKDQHQEESPKDNEQKNSTLPSQKNSTVAPQDDIDRSTIGIGYLNVFYSNGGIERCAQIITTEFAKMGYRSYLLTCEETPEDYPVGENVTRLTVYDGWLDREALIQYIKDYNINILIYNKYDASEVSFLDNLGIKLILCDHSGFFSPIYYGWLSGLLRYSYLNKGQAHLFLIKEEICMWANLGLENNFYVPNLIFYEPDNVTPSNLSSRIILMSGRLDIRQKRYEMGITAFSKVVKEFPDAEMYIVGFSGGYYRPLTERLNLTKKVHFPGYVLDMETYYKSASVFYLTSLWESFCHVLAEAKAFGIPCIITGMKYLSLAKNGTIIVGRDDVDAIAEETIKLFKDENYRKEQGRLARESLRPFENKYTFQKWDRIIKALMKGQDAVNEAMKADPVVCDKAAYDLMREEFAYAKTKCITNIEFEDLLSKEKLEAKFRGGNQ